jgi:hypothetical protein
VKVSCNCVCCNCVSSAGAKKLNADDGISPHLNVCVCVYVFFFEDGACENVSSNKKIVRMFLSV